MAPDPSSICEHGDVLAACLDCLAGAPPERPKARAVTPTSGDGYVVAAYDGWCRAGRDEIAAGDRIVESDAGWVHLECRDA